MQPGSFLRPSYSGREAILYAFILHLTILIGYKLKKVLYSMGFRVKIYILMVDASIVGQVFGGFF